MLGADDGPSLSGERERGKETEQDEAANGRTELFIYVVSQVVVPELEVAECET